MRCNELTAIILLSSHYCVVCQRLYLASNLGISKDALPDAELMRDGIGLYQDILLAVKDIHFIP
jgi:hypothetical protein